MAPIYKSYIITSRHVHRNLHVQDRRSRRTTITFVKRQSVSKYYFSLCKNISSASYMCVEGRLKQEKYKDVGSSMERVLRLGCKLNGKPFL